MVVREYLKLARSFNAGLTAAAPVLGAVAMKQFDLVTLFLLFLIGLFGHTYGFALNDILDLRIDKTSKEIRDRPLVSKKITIKKAWIFALSCSIASFILAFYLARSTGSFLPFIILVLSSLSITIYDFISKKFAAMDIFVAGGIFLLILYGASTVSLHISTLAWIVCVLGTIQVLFMQFIAGGLKDIKNDFEKGAKTLALKMGVRMERGMVKVTTSFKILAYSLQILEILLLFSIFFEPFHIFSPLNPFHYTQFLLLVIFSSVMLLSSHRLLSMKHFDRNKARVLIGGHFQINFMLVPILLMALNPWTIFLAVISPAIFVFSNLILHGTLLQPKTM